MRHLLFLALFAGAAHAASVKKQAFNPFQLPQESGCVQLGCDVRPPEKVKASRAVTSVFEPARRNCCSRQGGVCGCASGQSVCCDGALTAACGCD